MFKSNYFFKYLKDYYTTKKFKIFNKKIFRPKKSKSNPIILIEFNAFHTSHIALSNMANILVKKYNSKILAFYNYSIIVSNLKENILQKIKWTLSNILNLGNIGVYKSFGTEKIFKPSISKYFINKGKKNSHKIILNIKSKHDVLKIKYKDILIGDLIYDTYLKTFKTYTVNINDERLYKMIEDFISLCYYWDDFFKKNQVLAVLAIHSVYSFAIPIRVAIFNNIKVYAMNMERLFYLSKTNYFKGTDFHYFPEQFSLLSDDMKKKGKDVAKQHLLNRFKGKISTEADLTYTMVSSFSSSLKTKRVLNETSNLKLLISPHDFMDSIHVMGDLLFPDFYEWLIYLGQMSEETEYDWYIKNRPNYPGKFRLYQSLTNKWTEEICKKFPKIKIIDNDVSHHQLINEGINFVFTCYGSVGIEYPYYNIPVINACKYNPHYRYKFNLTPTSVDEYKKIILNLKNLSVEINKDEIYEFYFMRHIYNNRKWLTRDHKEMVKKIGGYTDQFSTNLYKYWINNYSLTEFEKTEKFVNRFVDSGDYVLSLKHQEELIDINLK